MSSYLRIPVWFRRVVRSSWIASAFPCGWLRILLVILCGSTPALASVGNGMDDPHAILQRIAKAYDGITDYTALFIKRERTDGTLYPVEKIRLRFQEPFKVHMTWVTPNEGRAVTYIEGKNDNKILVNPGGFLQFMRLQLDPQSPLAMGKGHHSIRQLGIRNMIDMVMQQYLRAHEAGDLTIRLHGRDPVDGRPAYHLEFIYPQTKGSGYYAYRAELWVDAQLYLPTKILIYNWDNQLYEYYEYRRLKLNPGLGPEAFELAPVPVPARHAEDDQHRGGSAP